VTYHQDSPCRAIQGHQAKAFSHCGTDPAAHEQDSLRFATVCRPLHQVTDAAKFGVVCEVKRFRHDQDSSEKNVDGQFRDKTKANGQKVRVAQNFVPHDSRLSGCGMR
jgi:hypothetical protein